MSFIKICGITREVDLEAVIESGATAVGLNVWPESPRCIGEDQAAHFCDSARGRIETVLVTVNHSDPLGLRDRIGADWVQLHGDEDDDAVGPATFKAVGLATQANLAVARRIPGDRILVDARDSVRRGGTGKLASWELASALARERKVILAGGLRPNNVAQAIREVRPWGVDTASGVEDAPGLKNSEAIHAFVRDAKRAFDG